MSRLAYIVRIAGYTTDAAVRQVAFTQASADFAELPYIGETYLRRRLADIPRQTGAQLGLLATSANGGAWSVSITFDDTDPVVYGLNDVTPSPFKNDIGEALRPRYYIAAADSTFEVLGTPVDISVGDELYLNSECMRVTAISGSAITVSRGVLGTEAVDHPAARFGGPVIYSKRPDLVGARCTITTAPHDAILLSQETDAASGIIEDISVSDGILQLNVAPLQRLLQGTVGTGARRWAPPRLDRGGEAGTLTRGEDGRFRGTGTGGSLVADREYPAADAEDWQYWRIVCGGAWAIFKFDSETVDITIDDDSNQDDYSLLVYSVSDWRAVAVGRGDELFSAERWGEVFDDGDDQEIEYIEYVDVWSGADRRLSTVVRDILGADATRPWSVSMRLSADDYDSASFGVLDAAVGAEFIRTKPVGPGHSDLFIFPFVDDADQLIAVLEKQFFEPTFTALATSVDGRMRCVDHRDVFVPTVSIMEDDIREPSGRSSSTPWRRARTDVLREVVYAAKISGATLTDTRTSDIATTIHAAGQQKRFELAALAVHAGALAERAQALLSTYEIAAMETTLRVRDGLDIEPGDTVFATVGTLPKASGQRGGSAVRFKVLQRSEGRARTQQLRGHLLGTDVGANWAQAVDVESYNAGTGRIYIDIDPYLAADDESDPDVYWLGGDYLFICDDELAKRSGTAVEVDSVGEDGTGWYIEVTSPPVTPAAGNVLRLGLYDVTPEYAWGFWADEDGVLGASNDEAAVWG